VRALATLGTAEQKTIDAVIGAVPPEFYDLSPRGKGKAAALATLLLIHVGVKRNNLQTYIKIRRALYACAAS